MPWPSSTTEPPPLAPAPPSLKTMLLDWGFGVVMPILCLVFDPIIFRSWYNCGAGILQVLALPAYCVVGTGIALFIVWRTFARYLQAASGFFAGVFALGSMLALSIGVAIAPLSFIGLLALGFGALGFTPFATAWVYGRAALQAWQIGWHERQPPPRFKLSALALTGAVAMVSVFFAGQLLAPLYQQAQAASNEVCTGYSSSD